MNQSKEKIQPILAKLHLPPHERRGTRYGELLFRKVPLNGCGEFWRSWKYDELVWRQSGYSVWKDSKSGFWYLQQWLKPGGRLTDLGENRVLALRGGKKRQKNFRKQKGRQKVFRAEKRQQKDFGKEVEEWEPDAELPEFLAGKLFGYQVKPARTLLGALRRHGAAVDCSDLGTGKTYVGLAAALATGKRVGVVCPLSVVPAWREAFSHFQAQPLFVANYEALRTGNRQWVSRSEKKRFAWNVDEKNTIVIFDEAHYAKTIGTLNQRMLLAAIRSGISVVALSGTLAKDPTEMYAIGRMLELHDGSRVSWVEFLRTHGCFFDKMKRGWSFWGNRERLIQLHHHIFPKRGVRVTIESLGDRFPETQILCQAYDIGSEGAKEIAAAWQKADRIIERLKEQKADRKTIQAHGFAAFMEARRKSEQRKVPAVVAMAKNEIEQGRSVVVFCNFTDTRKEIMEGLKTDCSIHGGQKPEERQKCVDEFQTDNGRSIVCNIEAGGVGVSLHDVRGKFPRTAIILPSPKAVAVKQALGRVNRAGGVSKSRQIVFFAADTVEEEICRRVRKALSNLDALNDGDLNPKGVF